jgi:cell division protein FtsL
MDIRQKLQFRLLLCLFYSDHALKLVVTLTLKQNRQWLMLKSLFYTSDKSQSDFSRLTSEKLALTSEKNTSTSEIWAFTSEKHE